MSCRRFSTKIPLFSICFFFIASFTFASGIPDAENAAEYIEIAQGYTDINAYAKAIMWYKKALKSPEYGKTAQYQLARVYALDKQWKKAQALLKPMYEESPDNTLVLESYAYVCAILGEKETAITLYQKYYEKEPDNPRAAENYVRILLSAKEFTKAQSLIERLEKKYLHTTEEQTVTKLKTDLEQLQKKEHDSKK